MSKTSIVTFRATPLAAASAAAGPLVVRGGTLTIQTADRVQLVDVTTELADLVRRHGIGEGIVSVWSLHTTCGVFINESQAALHADIKRFLEQMVARDGGWLHNDPQHSDCDRANADAHLRATLLGHSLTIQVSGGELVLGQWQRVLAAELDGPRARMLRVQAMGTARV